MLAQLEKDLSLFQYGSMSIFESIRGAIVDARKRYEKMSFEEREKELEKFKKEN